MGDQTPLDDKIIFANTRALAKYLDISERRLRQYKQSGRLNYTTNAVLVDRTELIRIRQSITAWAAPYVPHRFRSIAGRNKKALSRYARHEKAGHRFAESQSLGKPTDSRQDNNAPAEPNPDNPLNRTDDKIQKLMRGYGLSRYEALEVLKNKEWTG